MTEGEARPSPLDQPLTEEARRWLKSLPPQNPVPDKQTLKRILESPETKARVEALIARPKKEQPSAEQMQSYFQEQYGPHSPWRLTHTEKDGSLTEIRAFEFHIDPTNPKEVRGVLVDFGLRAAKVGYRQSLGPVVLPGAGLTSPERGSRPLTAIYFFLEKPQEE